MYKVVFQDKEMEVELTGDQIAEIDGREMSYDLVSTGNDAWNLIMNNQSHNVRLVSRDKASKSVTLLINNRTYTVSLRDRFDELLDKMGLSAAADDRLNELKAPMPGLVVEVVAQPGTEVQKGDTLLILEAMKMENVIKASGSALVKAVHIDKGQSVEKNQLLMSFE